MGSMVEAMCVLGGDGDRDGMKTGTGDGGLRA